MAEEGYNYDMAGALDRLLEETKGLYNPDSEIIKSLRQLAIEGKAMKAAWDEYATSESSTSESSNTGSSISDSSLVFSETSGDSLISTLIRNTTRRDEAKKRYVEHVVSRLKAWRMNLEDAKYVPIDFNKPPTFWTRKDRIIMKKEMLAMSCEARKAKIIEKMIVAKKCRSNKNSKMEVRLATQVLELLLQDIFLLHIMPAKEVVFPLSMSDMYDYERVSDALKGRHTPSECREFWYNKFHPEANSKCWSKAEVKALDALVMTHNHQHWVAIAAKLNTNRSAFQCYVQYRRYMYKDKALLIELSPKKDKTICQNKT